MPYPKHWRCDTCFHWRRIIREIGDHVYEGQCQAHPPSVPDEDHDAAFPATPKNARCGEWTPDKPETIEDGAVLIARLVLLGDKTGAYGLIDKLNEIRQSGG